MSKLPLSFVENSVFPAGQVYDSGKENGEGENFRGILGSMEKRMCDEERHEEVYTTEKPFIIHCIGTGNRLWHGRRPLTECDIEELQRKGITHILDLRDPPEWEFIGEVGAEAIDAIAARGIIRKNIPIRDATAPSPEALTEACAFLEEAFADANSCIYVHCRAGIERSGTILSAWRARREGIDFATALAQLQQEGARINPLPHQRSVAEEWLAQQ